MVAYSFNRRFIEPIRQGTKTQTIRANGKRPHARMGQALQLYTGMRTAHCFRIIPDVPCVTTMFVEIAFIGYELAAVKTDGIPVRDLEAFARRDGFRDALDMAEFWEKYNPHGFAYGFEGTVIEWAPPAMALMVAA